MIRWLAERVNLWVMLGAILVSGGLIVLIGAALIFLPPPAAPQNNAVAQLTVIPAPSATPTKPRVFATNTPTQVPVVGGISVGSYVQITGTEGAGLRLREGPGTGQKMRFVGMDSEVFQVKDGPKDADGYTWWYLEAPYDPSRTGWAAANYLQSVESPPTPTPKP